MTIIWNADNAAHLLRRATFSATPAEVDAAVIAGLPATVAGLFATPEPDGLNTTGLWLNDLQGWWLRRMLTTRAPLVEKLTLMWHNHFATGHHKVNNSQFMHAQNRLIRRYCLGNFNTLTASVCKSAAMLIWLDADPNTKGNPNRNLSRELMEVFTTGVYDKNGNPCYTEQDVAEGARALTGWSYVWPTGAFRFNAWDHDNGMKTFRGRTGRFRGEDTVLQLCQDPATARRVAWRLWNTFAWPVNLADPVLDPLEAIYISNNMALQPMVQYLFTCDDFYSDKARYAHVRNPCEWLVGGMRHMGAQFSKGPSTLASINWNIGNEIQKLGQSLFDPPSVFGWKEGLAWISSNGLFARLVVAEDLVTNPRYPQWRYFTWSPASLLPPPASWPSQTADTTLDWILNRMGFVPLTPGQATRTALLDYLNTSTEGVPAPFVLNKTTADSKIRGLVALLMSCPEYQFS